MKRSKSVKEMKKQLDSIPEWNWCDYAQSWWYRYFWNWVTDLQWRIPTWWHRSFWGWGKADCWSLDSHLSEVIYTSLCYFKEHQHSEDKEFNARLDKMIDAWKLANERSYRWEDFSKEEKKVMDEGMKLFIKHFNELWD